MSRCQSSATPAEGQTAHLPFEEFVPPADYSRNGGNDNDCGKDDDNLSGLFPSALVPGTTVRTEITVIHSATLFANHTTLSSKSFF